MLFLMTIGRMTIFQLSLFEIADTDPNPDADVVVVHHHYEDEEGKEEDGPDLFGGNK